MHRRPLLDALESYRDRHPDEGDTVARFIAFVRRRDDCFERACREGHVTASVWLVDRRGERVLLTHHRKLGRWLQLGGHTDGDADPLRSALREAVEESGLEALEVVDRDLFDLDIHVIPARGEDPEHRHYDVRYAVRACAGDAVVVSEESHDLAWVEIAALHEVTEDAALLRMAEKWSRYKALGTTSSG